MFSKMYIFMDFYNLMKKNGNKNTELFQKVDFWPDLQFDGCHGKVKMMDVQLTYQSRRRE